MKLVPMITLLCLAPLAHADDFCAAPALAIPDNNDTGITIPIEVIAGAGEIIEAIEVSLDIVHPWVGDLVITLESPSGTAVTLLDRPGIPSTGFPGPFGCGGRDLAAVFSDDASVAAEDLCAFAPRPVITGSVTPSEPLAAFAGEPASGTWTLIISDQSAYDTGVLAQVCLTPSTGPGCAADLNADGNLDFFDVSAFLSAFTAQDPTADFTGDGELNFFDVSAFLSALSAGCP